MKRTVFYSWQSDLPNSTNRGFIERVLENVAKSLGADGALGIEPVIDRDTAGVPGAPDIAGTILAKIDKADIFVCDVSIINSGDQGRLTPNPNVLIELGYAMRAMGPNRIVMVMNEAYGGLKELPFDLRSRRVLTFRLVKDAVEKAPVRQRLEEILERSIRAITEMLDKDLAANAEPVASSAARAIDAVENALPNRNTEVRRYLTWLNEELDRLSQPLAATPSGVEPVEPLMMAIDRTVNLAGDFARMISAIAIQDFAELALEVYRNCARAVDCYRPISGNKPDRSQAQTDFFRFMAHELFVSMIAVLLREGKLELIADILDESLYLENGVGGVPGTFAYCCLSEPVRLFDRRNGIPAQRYPAFHVEALERRHSSAAFESELARFVPMDDFVGADFLLFLRKACGWTPITGLKMNRWVPRFLNEAVSLKNASRLLRPLGVPEITSLRERLVESRSELRDAFAGHPFFRPLQDFDFSLIGSK